MATLIQNGTVVNADGQHKSDVLFDGETIQQVAPNIPTAGHTVVDATGLLVMPGGVDVHTHLDMPFGGTVSADDYGRDPIPGTLVAANPGRVVIAREDPGLGRLQVHFPRAGYVVIPA